MILDRKQIRQIIREIINEMVNDVIITTKKNLKKNNISCLRDVYNANNQIVTFSNKMKTFDLQIKSFLKKNMYFHQKVHSKTNFGRKIITKLFTKIRPNKNLKEIKSSH